MFAKSSAGYFLTRLAQRFDRIECTDPDRPARKQFRMTLHYPDVVLRFHQADAV
jgi:hypothetical protein